VAELDAMVAEFVADIGRENGTRWMMTPESYSFSKTVVNALVGWCFFFVFFVLFFYFGFISCTHAASQVGLYAQKCRNNISIAAMCPGWVGVFDI
jgi:hypothetical protein